MNVRKMVIQIVIMYIDIASHLSKIFTMKQLILTERHKPCLIVYTDCFENYLVRVLFFTY